MQLFTKKNAELGAVFIAATVVGNLTYAAGEKAFTGIRKWWNTPKAETKTATTVKSVS